MRAAGRHRPEPAGPAQRREVPRRIGRRWPRGPLPDTRYEVGPRLAPDLSPLSRGEGSGLQVSCTPRSRELPLLNFLVKAQIRAKILRTWGGFCRGWGLLLPSVASLHLLGIPRMSSFRGPESPTCSPSYLPGARERRGRDGVLGPWQKRLAVLTFLVPPRHHSKMVFRAPRGAKQ